MPYFKWKGIDWYGSMHFGTQFARSESDLERVLLKQEVGLIASKMVPHVSFLRPIPLSVKVQFFKELAILIESGILLHVSLDVIEKQIPHSNFKKVIQEIKLEVSEGISFADTIEKHPDIFDRLIVQMIRSGEESDKLSESLLLLSEYLEKYETFIRKLRSILLLPLITFSLFFIIAFIIFIVIIPSFSSIFTAAGQEIPTITQKILNFSDFLRGNGGLVLFFSLIFIFIFFYNFLKTKMGKKFFDNLIIKVPFIGKIIKFNNLTHFLQSTSLLLKGGVQLVKALDLSSKSVRNEYLKNEFLNISSLVNKGSLLSDAMARGSNQLFFPDLIAIVKVGEESGHLGLMLNKASIFYSEKINRLLSYFLSTIQPLLMIILGLLIALLIFAVYLPIFNLPNIIS